MSWDAWTTKTYKIGLFHYCSYCNQGAEADEDYDDGGVYNTTYYCTCDKGKLQITKKKHGMSIQEISNLTKEEAKILAKRYWGK